MIKDDVKVTLRISHTAFDGEIEDLILAARQDLIITGISKEKVEASTNIDPLIKRAIITYCKANFGFDNPEADRLQKSYEMLKTHLSLAGDYNAIS